MNNNNANEEIVSMQIFNNNNNIMPIGIPPLEKISNNKISNTNINTRKRKHKEIQSTESSISPAPEPISFMSAKPKIIPISLMNNNNALKIIKHIGWAFGVPIYNDNEDNKYYESAKFPIGNAFDTEHFGKLCLDFVKKSDITRPKGLRKMKDIAGNSIKRKREMVMFDEGET